MTPGKVHLVLGADEPRANERFFQALISTWNDSHHQHLHTEDMTETYYNEGGITMAQTNMVAVAASAFLQPQQPIAMTRGRLRPQDSCAQLASA